MLVGAVALGAVALGVGFGGACSASEDTIATGAPTTLPRTATVTIVDAEFDPRRVEVTVGGSVTWHNDDLVDHELVATTPNVIQSPLIGKAGSYTASFSQPGEYRYYCNIHNSMKGVVIVR